MDQKHDEQSNGQAIDVIVGNVDPVEAPIDQSPESPTAPPSPETGQAPTQTAHPSPETSALPVAAQTTPDSSGQTQQLKSGHDHKAPIVAIASAVVVAIALAGVTVYAYMQSQDTGQQEPEISTQQAAPAPTVSEQDVNQAEQTVEEALQSSEQADFPDAELTDQSLGL